MSDANLNHCEEKQNVGEQYIIVHRSKNLSKYTVLYIKNLLLGPKAFLKNVHFYRVTAFVTFLLIFKSVLLDFNLFGQTILTLNKLSW